MQAVNNLLYTPVDFSGFVVKKIFNINFSALGQVNAFELFDNAKLVSKVIKCMAAFKISSEVFNKIKEHCDVFKSVYCLFTAVPTCLKGAADAYNSFGYDTWYELGEKVAKFVKNCFDLTCSVIAYWDPLGLTKLTPMKYMVDGLDICDDAIDIIKDASSLLQPGPQPGNLPQGLGPRCALMKSIETCWKLAKNITSIAITVLGVLSYTLASSIAVPFYVLPVLGLACITFGLFSKYVAYFRINPQAQWHTA